MKTKTELLNELERLSLGCGCIYVEEVGNYLRYEDVAKILAMPDDTVSVPRVPTEAMLATGAIWLRSADQSMSGELTTAKQRAQAANVYEAMIHTANAKPFAAHIGDAK